MALTPSLPPDAAWQPLPAAAWDAEAARHLLRRAGWTARPEEAERAKREGLEATLDRLFPERPHYFPEPALAAQVGEDSPAYRSRIRAAAGPEERRTIQKEEQERIQAALQDLSLRWLEYARQPEHAAFAKWVLFLGDVYVVGADKVRDVDLVFRHFDLLARGGLGRAPELTKAVSRSPAMMIYLDLNQNRKEAPNENFARELFELFVLGEGNYTERDIKEAARAFTGYRARPATADFVFAAGQHDGGIKTVFGQSGDFGGDEVIDLAYGQRAAGAFLPHELAKFYLSDAPLPREHLLALGDAWRSGGYDLRWLARRFFGSRLFFAPEYRGNFIKSPVQFYLGMTQDLGLSVPPLPRFVLSPLRQMGQVLFVPPNVRGWVGGRAWINSTSLAARRTLAEMLFTPVDDLRLNADEARALAAARADGAGHFSVPAARLDPFLAESPAEAARRMQSEFLAAPPEPALQQGLADYLAAAAPGPDRFRRVRRAAITLLETPAYQLC
ncbi:MAG TPA: DUF1800 domain-containing protein [Opitutaceae bacterium]|nr:DUF1800 domain-containing protein [Opitutaceae bacterium]